MILVYDHQILECTRLSMIWYQSIDFKTEKVCNHFLTNPKTLWKLWSWKKKGATRRNRMTMRTSCNPSNHAVIPNNNQLSNLVIKLVKESQKWCKAAHTLTEFSESSHSSQTVWYTEAWLPWQYWQSGMTRTEAQLHARPWDGRLRLLQVSMK